MAVDKQGRSISVRELRGVLGPSARLRHAVDVRLGTKRPSGPARSAATGHAPSRARSPKPDSVHDSRGEPRSQQLTNFQESDILQRAVRDLECDDCGAKPPRCRRNSFCTSENLNHRRIRSPVATGTLQLVEQALLQTLGGPDAPGGIGAARQPSIISPRPTSTRRAYT